MQGKELPREHSARTCGNASTGDWRLCFFCISINNSYLLKENYYV